LDIKNMRPKDQGVPDAPYPEVREDDTCPHWECTGGETLVPMRECWYCKYSDFRKDISEHRARSVCRCPEKRSVAEKESGRLAF